MGNGGVHQGIECEEHATVLVVDDEQAVLEVTQRALEKYGFNVLTARDGEEGIAVYKCNAGRIDVILLDVAMPRMGGEEAFQAIRSIQEDARVVLISGYAEREINARFPQDKSTFFMQKPYLPTQLVSQLHDILASPK